MKSSFAGSAVAIPLTPDAFGLGLIVRDLGSNFLLAAYDAVATTESLLGISDLRQAEPIMLMETMDFAVTDGSWRLLGQVAEVPHVTEPTYKVWIDPPGGFFRMDVSGNVLEPLMRNEADRLAKHTTCSPPLVEAALRGFHGLGPWRDVFGDFLYGS